MRSPGFTGLDIPWQKVRLSPAVFTGQFRLHLAERYAFNLFMDATPNGKPHLTPPCRWQHWPELVTEWITPQAISPMEVAAERVLDAERATGVPRHELRPTFIRLESERVA